MKKRLWVLLLSAFAMLTLFATVVIVFNLLVLGHGPRGPKSDVPVIYQITRGSGGSNLTINNFEVDVLEAPLNLFNSRALVQVLFDGTIKDVKGWKPYIDAVQMSERYKTFGKEETLDIEAEPMIANKGNEKYQGEPVPFHLKIEYIVTAWKWGENRVFFHSRGLDQTVMLHHPK